MCEEVKKELLMNTKVSYRIADLRGTGKIVGKALSDQPIVGITYIIEPDYSIYCETYPYSHFIANESQLEVIIN